MAWLEVELSVADDPAGFLYNRPAFGFIRQIRHADHVQPRG